MFWCGFSVISIKYKSWGRGRAFVEIQLICVKNIRTFSHVEVKPSEWEKIDRITYKKGIFDWLFEQKMLSEKNIIWNNMERVWGLKLILKITF